MTEYDYSPEAYERYLATQNRIANWVDKTEQNRAKFIHPFDSVRPHTTHDSHIRSKHSPPPSPTHHYPQYQSQQTRQLFVHPPPPGSDSSDHYGTGPGPMPFPSPGMMFPAQHPGYHPMGQPMMQPAPMMMQPNYMSAPHHKSSHRRPSHSRSRSQHSPAYFSMASPPVSATGYQYPFPPMMGGGYPGYIMMQSQPHGGMQMPVMYLS